MGALQIEINILHSEITRILCDMQIKMLLKRTYLLATDSDVNWASVSEKNGFATTFRIVITGKMKNKAFAKNGNRSAI